MLNVFDDELHGVLAHVWLFEGVCVDICWLLEGSVCSCFDVSFMFPLSFRGFFADLRLFCLIPAA